MLPEHLSKLAWHAPHQAWLRKNGYCTAHVVPDDVEPSRANLYGANLYGANLYGANLYGANLYGANLTRANLTDANLTRANLTDANLTDANLAGANLYGANLAGANLYGANLYGANLTRANLTDANLTDAKELPVDAVSSRQIVPESGSFTVFKKVHAGVDSFIAELIVPSDAKRVGGLTGRKCRVSAAHVIDVKTIAGDATDIKKFHSRHDSDFMYRVGDLVEPIQPFCDDPKIVCASGIHCFITRAEAVTY